MDSSQLPLKNQTAIITGASSGIGRAIALRLAAAGIRCVLAARRESELAKVAKEISQQGGEALTVATDVTQEESRAQLIKQTVTHFGGLNVLVNNAGIYRRGPVSKLLPEELEQTLNVNLVAPMMLTRLALPHLKKAGGGAVINMASMAGLFGFPLGSAYCASKFGLMGFSQSLFEEVREDGIKVCAICPGYVDTVMLEGYDLDQGKMIPPEDVAAAVLEVLHLSPRTCPSQIQLRPQRSP